MENRMENQMTKQNHSNRLILIFTPTANQFNCINGKFHCATQPTTIDSFDANRNCWAVLININEQ